MSIYSVLDILGFLLAIYCISHKGKNNNKACMMFLFLWGIIVGLRGYGVGNDTSGYTYFYSGQVYPSLVFTNYGTLDLPADEIEMGFVILSRILALISTSPTFFFLIVSFLFFFTIYHFYKDNKFGIICLLWLFTSTYSMMNIIYAVRQCFSLGILFGGIILLEQCLLKYQNKLFCLKNIIYDKILLLSLFLIFLSVFVHRTSAVAIVLYFMVRSVRINKSIAYTVVILSGCLSLFSLSLIQEYFDMFFILMGDVSVNNFETLSRLQDTMDENHVSFLNLLSFILPCLVTIMYASKEEINSISFKLYIAAISLYSLFNSSPFMARFIVVFMILGYPAAVPSIAYKNKKLMSFYLLMTVYYLYKMVNQYANWPVKISSDLPYMFFWE